MTSETRMWPSIARLAGTLIVGFGVFGCQERASPPQTAEATPPPPVQDARDQILLASAKVALPPEGTTAADLPDPESRGAKLVATYCAQQCHALPSPSTHSATDWPTVVRRMWLRMDRLPPEFGVQVPETGERRVLLDYLADHALQVTTTLPEGAGREEFAAVCSQCHALPDPKAHTVNDWPAIFMRMERNIERMGVTPPTRDQTTAIVSYLQTVGNR